jgi:colanic acid biosynthesis glycosyl transferase WcaI
MLAACGLTSHNALSYRVLLKINQIVLRRAKYIFCIGRDMADHLTAARGLGTSDGIQVIPLWSDCGEILPTPRDTNPLLLDLGLTCKKLVVLYAGNMGRPHGIETLAAAIKELEADDEIHFIFMGSGSKRKILDEMVKQGARNLTVLPPRPRSAQREFLNACDVAILSLVPGMLGLAVPSRTYNLMAAGKPIIALVSTPSEVAQVVREEEIGWVVEPGQVKDAVGAILEAKAGPGLLLQMSARARRAAESRYSPANSLKQFGAFFPPVSRSGSVEELYGVGKV